MAGFAPGFYPSPSWESRQLSQPQTTRQERNHPGKQAHGDFHRVWNPYVKLIFHFVRYLYICLFILKKYLFMAALGLRCCAQAFSSCGRQRLLFTVVHALLITVASLVAKHGLKSVASVTVVHWLSGPVACAVFPEQGLNPHILQWEVIPNHWTTKKSTFVYFLNSSG